ncbi:MAG: AAA family ATPase, partial [Mariprofundaceae bacterium]|nr:AAA family ATPase [Mariprofundaceae bacterium]
RFVLLTGVSKFSKVSLFSGLNNLKDITLDSRYATICGYSDKELRSTFAEWLNGVDLDAVRHWYNGYSFDGEKVYNPFDVLLYLDHREFRSYWFETGSPSFLVRLLQERRISALDLNQVRASSALLSSFDVQAIEPEALLFQTGYLTIKRRHDRGTIIAYELGFPNFEVKTSFHDSLLRLLSSNGSAQERNSNQLYDLLESGNPEEMRGIFHAFFAAIPHDWYRKNQLANYEGYYCSIVYCYFVALGVEVIAEDATSKGRIDITVKLGTRIFIIEFKVIEMDGTGSAMKQIEEKGYAEKYLAEGEVWLIGVEFNSAERNIVGFEAKRVLQS